MTGHHHLPGAAAPNLRHKTPPEQGLSVAGALWRSAGRYHLRSLAGRFEYDSEAGMFFAYVSDRAALEQLEAGIAPVANHAELVRQLIAGAEEVGFEFDD